MVAAVIFRSSSARNWLPLGDWLESARFSWALVGLVLADALHYVMDWLPFWR